LIHREILHYCLLGDVRCFKSLYGVDGILHRFGSEGHLVNVELLVLDLTELGVVHFAAAEDLKCFLFKGTESGALCSGHLLLQLGKLQIALVHLDLNHFGSSIHLNHKLAAR